MWKSLTLALACLAGTTTAFAGTTSQYKASVEQLSRKILTVADAEKDDALEIVFVQNSIYSESAIVFGIAADALDTLRVMKARNMLPHTQRMRFTTSVPTKDEYGNMASRRMLSVTFLTRDLMKANYTEGSGLLPGELLNLYEKSWNLMPQSQAAIAKYCQEQIGKISHRYCASEAPL